MAPVLESIDARTEYGEIRIQAIGAAGEDILFVVYTDRDQVRRIISARRGRQKGTRVMAVVRKSLEQMRAGKARVDRAKIDATTEEDIRCHQIEDGQDPDAPLTGFTWNVPARAARMKLDMTQEQMAALLRIPVATLRNWEQGRVKPDQAAQALLTILYRRPEIAKEALTLADESVR